MAGSGWQLKKKKKTLVGKLLKWILNEKEKKVLNHENVQYFLEYNKNININ